MGSVWGVSTNKCSCLQDCFMIQWRMLMCKRLPEIKKKKKWHPLINGAVEYIYIYIYIYILNAILFFMMGNQSLKGKGL